MPTDNETNAALRSKFAQDFTAYTEAMRNLFADPNTYESLPDAAKEVISAGAKVVVNSHDVSREDKRQLVEVIKTAQHLHKLLKTDLLTSTPNHQVFMKEGRAALTKIKSSVTSKRQEDKSIAYTVVVLDLDNFKRLNDTYGHTPEGDNILINFARFLEENLRDKDLIVHKSGDEYEILFAGTAEQAKTKLNSIRDKFVKQGYTTPQGGKEYLSFSYGLHQLSSDDKSFLAAFSSADDKNKESKKAEYVAAEKKFIYMPKHDNGTPMADTSGSPIRVEVEGSKLERIAQYYAQYNMGKKAFIYSPKNREGNAELDSNGQIISFAVENSKMERDAKEFAQFDSDKRAYIYAPENKDGTAELDSNGQIISFAVENSKMEHDAKKYAKNRLLQVPDDFPPLAIEYERGRSRVPNR